MSLQIAFQHQKIVNLKSLAEMPVRRPVQPCLQSFVFQENVCKTRPKSESENRSSVTRNSIEAVQYLHQNATSLTTYSVIQRAVRWLCQGRTAQIHPARYLRNLDGFPLWSIENSRSSSFKFNICQKHLADISKFGKFGASW